MASQVKIYSPAGTEYDITTKLINSFPGFSESLEAESCVFTPGEMSLEAKNEDAYFTTLFAGADPNDRFNETTQTGAWAVKIWKNSVLRWVGNIDVESIAYDAKQLSCSFNCYGRLKRLERYNAAKVKRDLPDGTDATVLEFTSEKGRRNLDFTGHSDQYDLLEVGDVLHVQKAHQSGLFTEQEITVKAKLGSNVIKVKERLKAAYTEGICKTPFYRNKTLTFLVGALLDHATVPGGSQSMNSAYSASVVEYVDFTDKNVGEALAELCKDYAAKLFADPVYYYFQDRAWDIPGDSPKDITALLCEGSLQLLYESFYDRIVLRGRSPVKDKEKIIRVGNLTYPKRELEITTDYLYDSTTMQTVAEGLFDLWGYRRNAYSAEVEDDLTAYKMGQSVTVNGVAYWVIGYEEPAREHENITLTLLSKTGTAPDEPEIDLEADLDDDPPEPPTIIACTKVYNDWPTIKAMYPSKNHPRVITEDGSYQDDDGNLHILVRKWRMYFLVLEWSQDDVKGKLDCFHGVVFEDGGDPEDAKEDRRFQFNITNPTLRTDSSHGATEYFWGHIRAKVDLTPPYTTWRVAWQAIFEDGRKSEWSDDVLVGYEGDDATLPVPDVDYFAADKKKVTLDLSADDDPVGSRDHIGWLQVFKTVGTGYTGLPDDYPAEWKKIADMDVADDIDAGRFAWQVTGSVKNADTRYFTARFCYRDDKSSKGDFCTPVSVADTNNVAQVKVSPAPAFTGIAIDDDSQTNKVEMVFDVTLQFESANLANKDRIEVYVKKSLDGGVTYGKTLPLGQAELTAGDTAVSVNFYREAKKNQWVKLVKTVVWNGDAARVQDWNITAQLVATPLAIVSADVTPKTGQQSTTFAFSVAATGGTAPYTYQWTFSGAVTYQGGTNANSQNPQVQFLSDGAHWGKCTVTDGANQSVTTNQLMVSVGGGTESLYVTLTPSATIGTSPLSVLLIATVENATWPCTFEFNWGSGSYSGSLNNCTATLRNSEGLFNGGQNKQVPIYVHVTDANGEKGTGICYVTVRPPTIWTWESAAYNVWSYAEQAGSGANWTASTGGASLAEAIDSNVNSYIKASIPAGESSKYLWIHGITPLPTLDASAVILMLTVNLVIDPRDSSNTNLTQNLEIKWFQFTKGTSPKSVRRNKGDELDEVAQQGYACPWFINVISGPLTQSGPMTDELQTGIWERTDLTTDQNVGFRLKMHNAGSVTKVVRLYGAKLKFAYYLN